MDLSGVDEVDTLLQLDAYMMWPDNEKAREFYIAKNLAWYLSLLPEGVVNHPQPAQLSRRGPTEYKRLLLEALSSIGRSALGDESYGQAAYPMPVIDPVGRKRMSTVGHLVMLLGALNFQPQTPRGGAGLLKAIFLLPHCCELADKRIYTSRKEIFKSWQIYKKSCHLIAAELVLDWAGTDRQDNEYSYVWLAIAKYYQDIILNSTPLHGTKRPLAREDEIWQVPKAFYLPCFEFPPWDLSNLLNRYRAPSTR
jgi:hypothetical protein